MCTLRRSAIKSDPLSITLWMYVNEKNSPLVERDGHRSAQSRCNPEQGSDPDPRAAVGPGVGSVFGICSYPDPDPYLKRSQVWIFFL